MRLTKNLTWLVILLIAFAGCRGPEERTSDQVTPELTVDETMMVLEQMCTNNRPAIEARQAEATLFERAGGREGLRIVVEDTVRRHLENEQIRHLMEGVDTESLVKSVTDFLVVGTGGEGEYQGRDMVTAHAHLEISDADFLAATGDLREALDAAGWGEFEHQEMVCAFVALRGDVVSR